MEVRVSNITQTLKFYFQSHWYLLTSQKMMIKKRRNDLQEGKDINGLKLSICKPKPFLAFLFPLATVTAIGYEL